MADTPNVPDCNPVLFVGPQNELWLYAAHGMQSNYCMVIHTLNDTSGREVPANIVVVRLAFGVAPTLVHDGRGLARIEDRRDQEVIREIGHLAHIQQDDILGPLLL